MLVSLNLQSLYRRSYEVNFGIINILNINKMKLIKLTSFFFIFVTFISSCAVTRSTSYQKNGFTGGFAETRLGDDMFDVRFQGNGYTSPEKTNDFCLLRCAELAEQNNYPYFVVIDNKEGGSALSGQGNMGIITTSTHPSNHNKIKLFKQKPDNYSMVYEAKYIISSIKAKYNIK